MSRTLEALMEIVEPMLTADGSIYQSLKSELSEILEERDEIAKTGNEWYESFNNKRIECDALRQAWEGSKQIIKMLEAKLEAHIQWREVSGWKHDEQDKKIERLKKELESIEQAITDPENQPSQFGTVTLAIYEKMNLEAIKWKDKYDELLEQQLNAKKNQG